MNTSLWKATDTPQHFPALSGNIDTEIAIIGGGITGLTLALLLSDAGKKVVLAEARNIGDGDTGYTSGNLYATVSPYFHNLDKKFDIKHVRKIAAARSSTIDFIGNITRQHGIECEFRRQPWCLYTEKEEDVDMIRAEYEMCAEAGLPVSFREDIPLPFSAKVQAACWLEDQARFNAQQYLSGLARVLSQRENVRIFEQSRVISWEDAGGRCSLETEGGKIHAQKMVMATHTPVGVYFLHTLLAPYRSYVVAAKLKAGSYPQGVFWDTHSPYHHSTTTHSGREGDFLLVIGAGHKVGQKEDMMASYRELEEYARERYDVESFSYRWSAQHYRPADGLPYIGTVGESNTYVATGFHADGLCYGTLAAQILCDRLTGRENELAEMFSPGRHNPAASAKEFITENVKAAATSIKDYFFGTEASSASEIEKGEGKILKTDEGHMAVYRDENGALHAFDRKCTHMGCPLHWNNAEKSWDCHCHGSRFNCTGEVLEGPAVKALERKEINSAQ